VPEMRAFKDNYWVGTSGKAILNETLKACYLVWL